MSSSAILRGFVSSSFSKILYTSRSGSCYIKHRKVFLNTKYSRNIFSSRLFCTKNPNSKQWINVHFLFADGKKVTKQAEVGEPISRTIEKDDVFADRAVCESVCACSTCHVYVSEENFKRMEPLMREDEKDLLPYALDVTDTSRLACQIIAEPWMEGIELTLPQRVVHYVKPDSESAQS